MKYPQTKQRLFELLQAGHVVTVHWDCGGDESFVTTHIDGQEAPHDLLLEVDRLVTEALNLPDAGEFNMEGDGTFYLEGRGVGLDYKSDATVYLDDYDLDEEFFQQYTDEELLDMGLRRPTPVTIPLAPGKEEPEAVRSPGMSDEYTGRSILFELPD